MKFAQKLTAGIAVTGLTILIAILIAVRDQLVQIGPWVFWTLLAALGLLALYGLFRLYLSAAMHWHTWQAQKSEQRRIDEKHHMELLALQADIQAKTSYLLPDVNGNYPLF